MTEDEALLAALAAIQERGAIGGATPLGDSIEHAEQFVAMIPVEAQNLVDLGSGGGLPGLVIACRRPELDVVLVERRRSRADLLRRAVAALELAGRVTVLDDDVSVLARRQPRFFDVATARSFAAPAVTVRWAVALLRPGGRLVVSEPPTDEPSRWPDALLSRYGLIDLGREQGVRCFEVG